MSLDRDDVVAYTVTNLAQFVQARLVQTIQPAMIAKLAETDVVQTLTHQDLRTVRAMALTVYLAAMPGHTTLASPDELLPLMRSDWELLLQGWAEASGGLSDDLK